VLLRSGGREDEIIYATSFCSHRHKFEPLGVHPVDQRRQLQSGNQHNMPSSVLPGMRERQAAHHMSRAYGWIRISTDANRANAAHAGRSCFKVAIT